MKGCFMKQILPKIPRLGISIVIALALKYLKITMIVCAVVPTVLDGMDNNDLESSIKKDYCLNKIKKFPRLFSAYTNCCMTARQLIKEFAGSEISDDNVVIDNKQYDVKNYGFEGSYVDFIERDDQEKYVNRIAKKMFESGDDNKHMLFYIWVTGNCNHYFVVEKIEENLELLYRIYESWDRCYTLINWLGIKNWNEKYEEYNPYSKKKREEYGFGKLLSLEQVLMYIDKFIPKNTNLILSTPYGQRGVPSFQLQVMHFNVK